MKGLLSEIYQRLRGHKNKSGVGLYYWSPSDHRGEENFGDYLSRVIVERVVQEHYEKYIGAIKYGVEGVENRLLAIGSILHHARDHETIWGSGVNGKSLGQRLEASDLDVRRVRGPLTRRFLLRHNISCPPTYGEPGLLISEFFGKTRSEETKFPFSLVLNLNDMLLYEEEEYIIYPNWSLDRVIERIQASELVISTSLHGLVIAEAFGIPARHLLSFAEPTFKYIDYYEGTGRADVRFAHTLDEALDLGGVAPPRYDAQKMINCFPIEILDTRV
jgi:pyruvyltransferase